MTNAKIGDKVTHPGWQGQVMTISKIIPSGDAVGLEEFAIFEEGGFWRTSQLVEARSETKETPE